MEEGDVLHLLFRDEVGTAAQVTLNTSGDDDDAPEAPIARAASDITSTTFVANWYFNENSLGYYLDVAQDEDFTLMVAGYDNLDVGDVCEYSIAGLTQESSYFYRVRAYNDNGTSADSNTVEAETAVAGALMDIDGNVYTTVTIGTQQWIVENFKSTKYADGTAIDNLTNSVSTGEIITGWDEYTGLEPDTFVSAGKDITSLVHDADVNGQAIVLTNYSSDSLAVGDVINISLNLGVVSGSVPVARIVKLHGGIYDLPALVNGVNTINYTVTSAGEYALWLYCSTGTFNFSMVCSMEVTDGWRDDVDGAYCNYDNNVANGAVYGLLYNYYALTNAHGFVYLERDGVQEAGWRIPTAAADFYYLDGVVGGNGGKLKDAETGLWSNPNTGATNETGFTALPNGQRLDDGTFSRITELALFWNGDTDIGWGVSFDQISISGGEGNANYGFAVRLVKDL